MSAILGVTSDIASAPWLGRSQGQSCHAFFFQQEHCFMMRINCTALIVIVSIGSAQSLAGSDAAAGVKQTVVKAGRLIDTRGGRVLADQHIVIENDRIKQVGSAPEVPL